MFIDIRIFVTAKSDEGQGDVGKHIECQEGKEGSDTKKNVILML